MNEHMVIMLPVSALDIRIENACVVRMDFVLRDTATIPPTSALANTVHQHIMAYLRHPHLSFDFPHQAHGTPFQKRVWQALRRIPAGHTLSYTELAQQLGSGPRAVANACGVNPLSLLIPCHRAVAKHGLGGFMQGRRQDALSIKQWLLSHEATLDE